MEIPPQVRSIDHSDSERSGRKAIGHANIIACQFFTVYQKPSWAAVQRAKKMPGISQALAITTNTIDIQSVIIHPSRKRPLITTTKAGVQRGNLPRLSLWRRSDSRPD